jgi:CubicO group peptidase (beta-lactamase class C family)
LNKKLIMRSVQFLAQFCALAVLVAGCSPSPATAIPPIVPTQIPAAAVYWPTKAWRTSTPEEQGMDGQKLAQMLEAAQKKSLNLHSLLVIRNGYLVSETYFKSYQSDTKHELYSCTKSFISTLIGMAIDKGYIKGTDQRVVNFFPERTFENLDVQKQAMTLEDVLTMRSGLDWRESDPAIGAMYQSRDWVKHVLDMPMAEAPGTRFNYCSGCSHVLSAILQQTTGMNTRDFAEQYLFKPLGISNVGWDLDSQGIPIGGWGLQITPRDMAKLGYLYLHDGQWEGQQIVSARWVEAATQSHTETDGGLGYGYQWWTYPSLGAYTALGRDGQTIFVVPASNLVIVTTAQMDSHDEIFKLIEEYILPAVQDSR